MVATVSVTPTKDKEVKPAQTPEMSSTAASSLAALVTPAKSGRKRKAAAQALSAKVSLQPQPGQSAKDFAANNEMFKMLVDVCNRSQGVVRETFLFAVREEKKTAVRERGVDENAKTFQNATCLATLDPALLSEWVVQRSDLTADDCGKALAKNPLAMAKLVGMCTGQKLYQKLPVKAKMVDVYFTMCNTR